MAVVTTDGLIGTVIRVLLNSPRKCSDLRNINESERESLGHIRDALGAPESFGVIEDL